MGRVNVEFGLCLDGRCTDHELGMDVTNPTTPYNSPHRGGRYLVILPSLEHSRKSHTNLAHLEDTRIRLSTNIVIFESVIGGSLGGVVTRRHIGDQTGHAVRWYEIARTYYGMNTRNILKRNTNWVCLLNVLLFYSIGNNCVVRIV